MRVDAADERGRTPLHFAASQGHTDVALFLLENGAYKEARTHETGKTPLMFAAQSAQLEMLRLLLSHGCHVNACDNEGQTSLILHLDNWEDEDCMRELLSAGADVNVRDSSGATAMVRAGLSAISLVFLRVPVCESSCTARRLRGASVSLHACVRVRAFSRFS